MLDNRNDYGSLTVMGCFDVDKYLWLKVVATADVCVKTKYRVLMLFLQRYVHAWVYSIYKYIYNVLWWLYSVVFDDSVLNFTGDLYI